MARKGSRYQIWEVKCVKEGQKLFLKNLDNKGCRWLLQNQKLYKNVETEK